MCLPYSPVWFPTCVILPQFLECWDCRPTRDTTFGPRLPCIHSLVTGRHYLKACWILYHVPSSVTSLVSWPLHTAPLSLPSHHTPLPLLTLCPWASTRLFVPSLSTQSLWSPHPHPFSSFLLLPSWTSVQATVRCDRLGLSEPRF